MTPSITELLVSDHRRIGTLLARAREGERAAYDELRGALLRHIGIEEKILLPALRARLGESPGVARQLRLDHSAIVAMLVPPPSPELLARLSSLLEQHDVLEEGDGGLYRQADDVLAGEPDIVERMRLAPTPPLAPHFDGERAHAAIDALVARAAAARDDGTRS